MEIIQQCIIRSGFQLLPDFYYRNKKTGEIMTEPLIAIGDKEHFLSLDAAIVSKEELMSYFDAVNGAVDLYGNEFIFRHFALDFSIYNSENGRKLIDFPFHRSFSNLYQMLKYWMDETKNGEYFFRYDNKVLDVYRHRDYISFTKIQLVSPSAEKTNIERDALTGEEMPPPLETIAFPDGWEGIPIITFRTPARAFLNVFWHELFRAENFCRQVSKQLGIYENIWDYRRLVPEDIDKLIMSQNQLSFFLEVQDAFELSIEGKYFTPSRKSAMVTGVLKKGTLHIGEEIICLNGCYKEEFRCTVEAIEQPPIGNITEASLEVASQNGDDRFTIEVKDKNKKDFDSVFYICKK